MHCRFTAWAQQFEAENAPPVNQFTAQIDRSRDKTELMITLT
jgi:hypothetical protein